MGPVVFDQSVKFNTMTDSQIIKYFTKKYPTIDFETIPELDCVSTGKNVPHIPHHLESQRSEVTFSPSLMYFFPVMES